MGVLTVLLGGARSGKSSLALQLAGRHSPSVTFIATAEALDTDMAARIERHREERPTWTTIEESRDLVGAIDEVIPSHALVIDCLTMWATNLLLDGHTEDEVLSRSGRAIDAVLRRSGPTIAITNEVGLGIVPATKLGREFRDVLGRMNQQWFTRATNPYFVVAGMILRAQNPLQEFK